MKTEKALNLIAGLCSKKECCSQDIREKLKRWEISEEDTKKIMDFLYRGKFIDDARFARIYAEDKFRFNHWGRHKIALMLRQKNIAGEWIDEALKNIAPEDYHEQCLTLLQQKNRSIQESDPYKLRGKLTRFAQSRGFDFDTINRCIEEIISEREEEENRW